MWVKSILFYNFRNIQKAILNLESGLNILVGQNAQGKTNFIEGVCLALSGESFRFCKNSDLSLIGTNQTSVALKFGDCHQNDLKFSIENGRKFHWINGKITSAQTLASKYPVILFSPESLAVVKEGSSNRRNLIDLFLQSCPDLGYGKLFDDFSKVLKSRNKVLKLCSDGKLGRLQTEEIISTYQDRFLDLATKITFERIQGMTRLFSDLCKVTSEIFPVTVNLSVEYLISEKNAMHYMIEQVRRDLEVRLYELKSAEFALGYSLVGPHKHEINFLLNNRDSRTFCSQGQQRALILSFKLAQLMYHRRVYGLAPVLFLDDVLSELDGQTRVNLVRHLNQSEGQIFLTTTDQYLCRDFSIQRQRLISVDSGQFIYL